MYRVTGEEDKMFLCPYNKSHNIRLTRMAVHLVKCRKNHVGLEKAECPFNVTHVMNKVELDLHIKVCPQRTGFEMFLLKDEIATDSLADHADNVSVAGIVESFEVPEMAPVEDSQSTWETHEDVPTYNPTIYTEAAKVLRQPRGLTPSERRQFRAKERERLLKKESDE